MKTFHLTSDGDRWKLKDQDDGAVLFFDTKAEALQGSTQFMRERGGSLRIHRADGTFQQERTYPRALDPVESRG